MNARTYVPAEHAKNKIEHKERSDNNERNKIDPVEPTAKSVVHLRSRKQ